MVGLGAYTRLTDAGLGCPDWPGCYGFISVPQTQAELQTAQAAYPETPVEPIKAWNEMIHRYIAGVWSIDPAIAVMAWCRKVVQNSCLVCCWWWCAFKPYWECGQLLCN